jgi:hypothetical protein
MTNKTILKGKDENRAVFRVIEKEARLFLQTHREITRTEFAKINIEFEHAKAVNKWHEEEGRVGII